MGQTWLRRIASRLTVKRQVPPATADHRAELRVLVTKAWNLRRLGNLEGALIILDQAIALAPGDPETYYTRGLVRCAAKRYDDAITDLDHALELRPHYPEALTERGLAYVNRGALTRGIADYDAALQIDPAYATALDNKGSALCLKQLWTHALPLLDRALRLAPTSVNARHNRSVAHQLLGDPGRALVDLERFAELAGDGAQRLAAQRLARLRALVGDQPHAWTVADELWPEHVTLSLEHSIAELLSALRKHGAYHVVLPLAGGGHAVVPVYEASGLRVRLTEIADLVGPAILTLQLGQLLHPLAPCTPIDRTATHDEAMQAVHHSGGRTLVVDGDQILGVLEAGTNYDRPQLPTTLFGPRARFGRSTGRISRAARRTPEGAPKRATGDATRTCAGCALEVAYYHPTLVDDKLTSVACPRCGRDPIPDWIEQRMRPGGWSRAGFLDATERVRDVIERDARVIDALGLTHAQLAAALDRLLDRASTEDEPRIARAMLRFHERMIEAGLEAGNQADHQTGTEWLDGGRALELAPSLDEIVRQLRRGELPPDSQGVVIDGLQVFLKVYFGYQSCPWTMLRRPYCAAEAPWPMQISCAESVRVRGPVLGAALPCSGDVTFRHGDRDFLVIDRRTRMYLRGSGLLPHLIREHHFFGGAHSPYRLDPERAARVLRLIGA
jgi:tetratricopeptide (TPR) repeat protein